MVWDENNFHDHHNTVGASTLNQGSCNDYDAQSQELGGKSKFSTISRNAASKMTKHESALDAAHITERSGAGPRHQSQLLSYSTKPRGGGRNTAMSKTIDMTTADARSSEY